MKVRRGDIYIVDFDKVFPEGKHYQRGRRPCVITSNDKANEFCELVNVIPLTSKKKHLPQQLKVHSDCLTHNGGSYLLPECGTCMDKRYLEYKLGYVTPHEMKAVELAIKIQNGIGDKSWKN